MQGPLEGLTLREHEDHSQLMWAWPVYDAEHHSARQRRVRYLGMGMTSSWPSVLGFRLRVEELIAFSMAATVCNKYKACETAAYSDTGWTLAWAVSVQDIDLFKTLHSANDEQGRDPS